MGIKQQYRPLVVLFAALSSILLIFTVIVPAQVRAQETQENPNITFSNVYFERWGADLFSDTYSQTDGWAVHDRGTLKAQFGVEPGVAVQNGDEFWLEMPESYDGSAFKFLDTSSVPLKLEDGTEVGTCVLTNELSPSRVTYTVAAEDVADNQNFQGSFALNVRATDTLDTVTPEMNSSGGVVTGELPTRTFTNIPNPADGKRTWTEAPADYNTYGIIPRNDISRDPRTDITKAGDWGRDANNWRVYFGANAIDKNGTVVITDTLAEDQQFQPNGNVSIDIRRMYQFTDENLGVEHQYMGAYRPQETAQLEDQPTVFPGTMDEGINVDGVEMTVEVQGQSVTYTITGLPTGDDIFDYRVSFAANHASELDRYSNSVTIGERTARATVTRPGATPPNQARAEY